MCAMQERERTQVPAGRGNEQYAGTYPLQMGRPVSLHRRRKIVLSLPLALQGRIAPQIQSGRQVAKMDHHLLRAAPR